MIVHTRRGTFTHTALGRGGGSADGSRSRARLTVTRVTSRLLGSAGVVVLGMLREENIKD